ncbi:MAG: dTMP kinase [Polyangiaceae bacterium]
MKSPGKGILIAVEGIDGAGTTTQIARYASYLRDQGRGVHVTREPSTGPIGTFIRDIMAARVKLPSSPAFDLMALLFAADRLDHVRGEIEPHLAEGDVVLSDRYDLSSLAYQSADAGDTARRLGVPVHEVVSWIRQLNRFARRPDVTLVVDVAPDVAAERRQKRGGPEDLYETAALQARLARAYAHAEALVPGDKVIHVRGEGSVDEVAVLVREALAQYVGV